MHHIEEILKQLNEKSAVIQPGSVELLSTIQERLMRRSQKSVEPPEIQPTQRHDSATRELELEAIAAAKTQDPSEQELSPLARSILDSNRRLRGGQQHRVAEPRFLAQRGAMASAGHTAHRQASEYEISDSDLYQGTDHYTLDRSIDYGFEPDASSSSASLGSREIVETPELKENFDQDSEQETSQATVKFPFEQRQISPVSTPSENLPPPVPHFDRAQSRTKNRPAIEGGQNQSLPIFDSVWFRRSAPTKAVAKIADSIISKVPPVAPATLQFTQSLQSQADGPLIATQIAWELSRRVQDDVLLVDADFQLREISRQLENVYLPGLGEMLNLDEASAGLVRKTGVDRLYWLASGQSDVSFRKGNPERWSRISAELKSRFQYICIYSGGAEDKVAATWGRFCDFTFLIACMKDDLGPTTQDVINHLRKNDSRISGLITVD